MITLKLHRQSRHDEEWRVFRLRMKNLSGFSTDADKRLLTNVQRASIWSAWRRERAWHDVKGFHLCLSLMQLRELNDRFYEVNTELLSCMAAFSPLDLFAPYDQGKLVTLATN